MPRNISFALTTEQVINRTKTVTRRNGWRELKVGTTLNACRKCMGLKPGEKIEKLATIKVVAVSQEPLSELLTNIWYGASEAGLEGFPDLDGAGFVKMFLFHMGGTIDDLVTRIEFEYVDHE